MTKALNMCLFPKEEISEFTLYVYKRKGRSHGKAKEVMTVYLCIISYCESPLLPHLLTEREMGQPEARSVVKNEEANPKKG